MSGGFHTGDVGLEDPDRLLSLLVDKGNRDVDLATSCICELGEVVGTGAGLTLILVFTLMSAGSL